MTASVDSGALTAPGAPLNLTFTVTGGIVTLNWTAPASGDPATAYAIEAGLSPGETNLANFDTGTTATSFTATDVPGGTYYVRVRARNSAGTSGVSNEVTITVAGGPGPCVAPGPPTGVTAVVTGVSVTLSWNAVAGATSYVLEAGSSPGASNLANVDTGRAATTFTVPSAPAGTYYVRLRARNACGTSGVSAEVTFTIAAQNLDGRWTGTTSQPRSLPNGLSNAVSLDVSNRRIVFVRFGISVPGDGCVNAFEYGTTEFAGRGISASNTFTISGDTSVLRRFETFSMSGTFTSSSQASGSLTVTTTAACVGTVTVGWTATK